MTAAETDTTAWLIEFSHLGTPHYYGSDDEEGLGQTDDHLRAIRFSRKEDAQAVIDDIGWTEAKPVEHMWCAPRAHSPAATMEGAEPVAWQERMKSPTPEIDREWFEIDQADFEQNPAQYDYRALYTHPAPAAPTLEADGLVERAAAITQLREQARHYPTVAGENMRLRERVATAERERDEARSELNASKRMERELCRQRDDAINDARKSKLDSLDAIKVWAKALEAAEAKVLALTEALSNVRINVLYGFATAALAQIDAALEQAKPAAALSPDKGASEP